MLKRRTLHRAIRSITSLLAVSTLAAVAVVSSALPAQAAPSVVASYQWERDVPVSPKTLVFDDQTTNGALYPDTVPPGMELVFTAGDGIVLQGTPTVAGFYTVRYDVIWNDDGGAGWVQYAVNVTVTLPMPVWVTNGLPDFHTGIAGSVTLLAENTVSYSVDSGSLPAGLTLTSAGVLSGTPTVSGTFTVGLRAANEDGTAVVQEFALRVIPAPTWVGGTGVVVTVGHTAPLPGHFENVLSVSSIVPAGSPFAYSNGVVTGITPGTGSLLLTGTGLGLHPDRFLTITVLVVPEPVWSTTSVADFGVGVAATRTLVASTTASYAVVSGELPPGLTLSASGSLSGTPTTVGSYPVTVRATNFVGDGVDRDFTLVVRPAPSWDGPASLLLTVGETVVLPLSVVKDGTPYAVDSDPAAGTIGVELRDDGIAVTATGAGHATLQVGFTSPTHGGGSGVDIPVEVRNAPVWVTTSLGEVREDVAVDLDLEATDATGYALAAGSSLPAGLSLAADGSLTGTPTGFGPYAFTVEATNGDVVVAQAFTGSVLAPLPVWATQDIPLLPRGVEIEHQLVASDAVAYALTDGELPPGLELVGDSIAGTPTEAGEFEFEVTAFNASDEGVTHVFVIAVGEPVLTVELDASPGDPAGGAGVAVTGSGLAPDAGFDATLHSDPIVIVDGVVAPDGTLDVAATLPDSVPFGAHELRVTTTGPDGEPVVASIWFSVGDDGRIVAISTVGPVAEPLHLAPAAPAPAAPAAASSGLAGTGVEAGLWVVLALVLGFAGAATAVGARVTRRVRRG